MEDWELT
jgi:hypothetical protein